VECVKAAALPVGEQVRRWSARQHFLVTMILIGINVAVFLLASVRARGVDSFGQRGSGLDITNADYGLFGPSIRYDREWWRIVTAGFLHVNLVHILFNMAALAQFGRVLEAAFGRVRYLALYVTALLAGSAGALLVRPDAVTVGASGAIFGLMAALALTMHRRGMNIWQTGIGAVLVLNLVVTFAIPNISVGGHVGGLVGGGLTALALDPARKSPSRSLGWFATLAVGVISVGVALYAAGR
jgi:membrane associated rhomboid family serine protease